MSVEAKGIVLDDDGDDHCRRDIRQNSRLERLRRRPITFNSKESLREAIEKIIAVQIDRALQYYMTLVTCSQNQKHLALSPACPVC